MRKKARSTIAILALMAGIGYAPSALASAPPAAERPVDQERSTTPSAVERERRYAGLSLGDAMRQSLIDDDLDFTFATMSGLAQANDDTSMMRYFSGMRAFARGDFSEAATGLAEADGEDLTVAAMRTWSLIGENKGAEGVSVWDAYGDSGRKPFYASYRALIAEQAGQKDVAMRNYRIAQSTGELLFTKDLAKRYAVLLVGAGKQRDALRMFDEIFGETNSLEPEDAAFRTALVARRPPAQEAITPRNAVSALVTNYVTAGMIARMYSPTAAADAKPTDKPAETPDSDTIFVSDALALRSALLMNPGNVSARFSLADMFASMDEDEAAQKVLEGITTGPRLNDARMSLARTLHRLEDPDRGITVLNSIPEAARDSAWWDSMADLLNARGQYRDSLAAVERSVVLAKGKGEWTENLAQLGLASALMHVDRRSEAIVIAQSLVSKLEPTNPLRGAAGGILLESPATRAAGLPVVRASLTAIGANGRSKAGVGSALMNNPETRAEGLQLVRDGLAEFPRSATLMNALGYNLVRYDIDLDEGFRLLQKALDIRPNSGAIMDSLGRAHYKLGNLDEAARLIEGALVALKGRLDPEVFDNLGDVYWHQGRRDDARAQWRRAKEIGGDYDGAAALDGKIRDGLTTPAPTKRNVPMVAEPGSI